LYATELVPARPLGLRLVLSVLFVVVLARDDDVSRSHVGGLLDRSGLRCNIQASEWTRVSEDDDEEKATTPVDCSCDDDNDDNDDDGGCDNLLLL
jgi:hypothetical protein